MVVVVALEDEGEESLARLDKRGDADADTCRAGASSASGFSASDAAELVLHPTSASGGRD